LATASKILNAVVRRKRLETMREAIYQVFILGGFAEEVRADFEAELRRRAKDLGEDVAKALQILGPIDILIMVRTAPAVAVYFGNDAQADRSAVDDLFGRSVPFLPVVKDLKAYSACTPVALHPVNGSELGDLAVGIPAIVNLAFENLALLRRSRRLFLSYFRKESTPVAHQLRVAFDDRGYDAFLDTNSVPKGDDFQDVLMHRLLDSDVMIVLDTASFMSSPWTQKELASASAMGVGLLRVIWPGVEEKDGPGVAERLYLREGDFDGDWLQDDAVGRIVAAVEALRARCIAARHTNLIVEFCEEAKTLGASTAIQPGRYVLAKLKGDRRIAAIPAVGVLDAQRYHEAHARFPAEGEHADEAVLIYEHRGMMPHWTRFLDWLDTHLPVRGLRVTETAAKLGAKR
jgi:hypothetical protein